MKRFPKAAQGRTQSKTLPRNRGRLVFRGSVLDCGGLTPLSREETAKKKTSTGLVWRPVLAKKQIKTHEPANRFDFPKCGAIFPPAYARTASFLARRLLRRSARFL